jgi:hypothetical protein
LRFGSHGEQVTGLVTYVEQQKRDPATLCQKYALSQDCLLLIREPSITLYVRARELAPNAYAGTPIAADVQIGSQRVLSLFPGIGWLAGR